MIDGSRAWRVSDYQIVLVRSEGLENSRVEALGIELSRQLRTASVVLTAFTPAGLAALEPSILAYDLKAAGRVLAGAPQVLDGVASVDPALIPVTEARDLSFARHRDLLSCIGEHDLHGEPDNDSTLRIALGA